MKPVECAKCGRFNSHGGRRCEGCNRHLYVFRSGCRKRILRKDLHTHRRMTHSGLVLSILLGFFLLAAGTGVIVGLLGEPAIKWIIESQHRAVSDSFPGHF
jgi:hypothetical protein